MRQSIQPNSAWLLPFLPTAFLFLSFQLLSSCASISEQPIPDTSKRSASVERMTSPAAVSTPAARREPLRPQKSDDLSPKLAKDGSRAQFSEQAQRQLDQLVSHYSTTPAEQQARASPLQGIQTSRPTRLMQHFTEWERTPYRLGGRSKRGVDCSAFVQIAFHQTFEFDLPRTTAEQMRVGKKVSRSQLQVGDMVFFKTGSRTYHNGIYIGNLQFMHASTSKGVVISELTETYWDKRFYTARRVLD
ncbi:MAG: C40 family peptidase [Thiotrichales bacterium]|nr:C40 family peptidase [Thiotrichales bacterium]